MKCKQRKNYKCKEIRILSSLPNNYKHFSCLFELLDSTCLQYPLLAHSVYY